MAKRFFGKTVTYLSLFLSALLLSSSTPTDPQKLTFVTLMKLDFSEVYNSTKEKWEYVPEFSKEVMDLNGKEVFVKGYIIPVDLSGELYALSAYPFSSCFFCGGAGPESVVGLQLKKPKTYQTDDIVTFTGTLRVSTDYESEFFYTLESAKEYNP